MPKKKAKASKKKTSKKTAKKKASKKAASKKPDTKKNGVVNKSEHRQLSCALSNEEQRQRGVQLAEKEQELEALLLEKKTITADYNARAKVLKVQVSELTEVVNSKSELRDVEVYWEKDYKTNVKKLYRQDTKEKIDAVALTSDERQAELGLGQDGSEAEAG